MYLKLPSHIHESTVPLYLLTIMHGYRPGREINREKGEQEFYTTTSQEESQATLARPTLLIDLFHEYGHNVAPAHTLK
jgi:hypothetical protein